MTPLVIVGAGRHGRELEAYLRDLGSPPLGFLDEGKPKGAFGTSEVLGGFADVPELLRRHGPTTYITATGSNSVRRRLARLADEAGLTAASLVHPSALVGMECEIGAGTCLAPRTVLTRDVRLGAHCIVNVGVTVSHDCRIGHFVNLNPGVTLCGDVIIGDDCYIGAGTTVIDKITIGPGTIVGAGAVVVRDLPAGVLAVGVPARVVRRLQTEPPAA